MFVASPTLSSCNFLLALAIFDSKDREGTFSRLVSNAALSLAAFLLLKGKRLTLELTVE